MIRIKICGITRTQDALLAADLGAAAIGMVFSSSNRKVSIASARDICTELPPFVDRVGVFSDAKAAEVRKICKEARLTRIQLHGKVRPESFASLPWSITRALVYHQENLWHEIERWSKLRPDAHFLIDLPKERKHTDRDIEKLWDVAASIAKYRPLILAGGLNPGNVLRALDRVRPSAVDVARGVERSPGKKDPGLLRDLFAAVKIYADHHRGSP